MSFDAQAETFEARAGLPDAACRDIALAVIDLAALQTDDLLVEIGPGTGQIGLELACRVPRYLGLDASPRMLDVFRSRLDAGRSNAELVVGDAAARWPVSDRSARCIFGSRSLHLLPAGHVAAEAARTASSLGALLLLGRVRRETPSLRERMRKKLRELVGSRSPSRRGHSDALLAECRERGAVAEPERVVARWQAVHSVGEILAGWTQKADLGKAGLDSAEQRRVLEALQSWALSELGDPATRHASTESYVLSGARFG